jgi:hypothetical protein
MAPRFFLGKVGDGLGLCLVLQLFTLKSLLIVTSSYLKIHFFSQLFNSLHYSFTQT